MKTKLVKFVAVLSVVCAFVACSGNNANKQVTEQVAPVAEQKVEEAPATTEAPAEQPVADTTVKAQ